MRCTGKFYRLLIAAAACVVMSSGCSKPEEVVAVYEEANYNKDIYKGTLFAENLCTAEADVTPEGGPDISTFHSAALFDVNHKKVDYACRIYERLYPASTTKIMTALVAIKNGDLSEAVTAAAEADISNFAWDEKTCGIKSGDQLTLGDLLHGLLMESGNDAAVAIAVHVAGSTEAFSQMMNEEAQRLMATNTHFVNSNGLHHTDHYTTAYDLYLIFNECIKHQEFVDIINTKQYTAEITGADGTVRQLDWAQTNFYATGEAELPAGATVIGGKTGTTDEAGNCLILLNKTSDDSPYISVVMGATTKALLYQDMTALINGIPANE